MSSNEVMTKKLKKKKKIKKKGFSISSLKARKNHSHSQQELIAQKMQQALKYLQAGNLTHCQQLYLQVLSVDPNNADAYHFLGVTAYQQGNIKKATELIEKSIRKDPTLFNAHNTLGVIQREKGQLSKAVSSYKKALFYRPDFIDAHNNLGNVQKEMGRLDDAIACYKRALSFKPDDAEIHSNLLFLLNYQPHMTQKEIYEESLQWDKLHGVKYSTSRKAFNENNLHNRKIKIGYVSPDFYLHPVGRFILPLFSAHNHNEFEIYSYSNSRKLDSITEKIKNLSDHWLDITGLNDESLADNITQNNIDILVDLAGHSGGNRLGVFARKAAPIQVSWLGYVNTTGLSIFDYRITDDIVDPVGDSDKYHSESLVRLANGFFCFLPPEKAPEITELPALKKGRVTFGSCNNLCKINDSVVSLWTEILTRVPQSLLVLKNKSLADESIKKYFTSLFVKKGIEARRIILLPGSSFDDYLNSYNKIDICLDPFPHNGHTVSCDALWMGCPVITLQGNRYAGRMGTDLLTRLGLTELVAGNKEEYVRIAVELADNLKRLAGLRAELRHRFKISLLCDEKSFARTLENAFRLMVHGKNIQ